jgi:hypothetical protein
LTLFGGTESDDGKAFHVERIGVFAVEPGTVSETVTVDFGDGIAFANAETGETGTITGADIFSDRMIWYYRADGLYDLYSIAYGNRRDELSNDEWPARNKLLMGWENGMQRAIRDAGLHFADGTYRGNLIGEIGRFFEDDTAVKVVCWGVFSPVDTDALESITVAGVTYPIN